MRGHQPASGQRSLFTPQQRHWKQINALQIPIEDRKRFGRGVQAGNVFAVLQCMYRLAEKNPNEECTPSARWLAGALHIKPVTVRRAWRVLEGMGLLIATPRFGDGGHQTSTVYRFCWSNFPAVEEIDQAAPPPPRERGGAPTEDPNQDPQDFTSARPVGAVGGDLNRLRELQISDLSTVAAVDRLFGEVLDAGGFGLARTSEDRLDFHSLVASVARAKREKVCHSPVGFLLHRIGRGPDFWRPKLQPVDRETALREIAKASTSEVRPGGTEALRT